MNDPGTKLALRLIQGELDRLPEADREKVADQVLGALHGHFVFLPRLTETEEAATRATVDSLLPGIFTRGAPS